MSERNGYLPLLPAPGFPLSPVHPHLFYLSLIYAHLTSGTTNALHDNPLIIARTRLLSLRSAATSKLCKCRLVGRGMLLSSTIIPLPRSSSAASPCTHTQRDVAFSPIEISKRLKEVRLWVCLITSGAAQGHCHSVRKTSNSTPARYCVGRSNRLLLVAFDQQIKYNLIDR